MAACTRAYLLVELLILGVGALQRALHLQDKERGHGRLKKSEMAQVLASLHIAPNSVLASSHLCMQRLEPRHILPRLVGR